MVKYKILLCHSSWSVSITTSYALGFIKVTHFNNFVGQSPLKFRKGLS